MHDRLIGKASLSDVRPDELPNLKARGFDSASGYGSGYGEDVMGIFFNEFNRYKKKSESGQIFTPEHITDFMYKILEVDKDDRVLDAT